MIEKYRQKSGFFSSKEGDSFGLFFIPFKVTARYPLKVLSSPSDHEWHHVSVSLPDRCPTWEEMSFIKNLFYGEDSTVIQFHPKKSEYVNNHPFCLHLWKNNFKETELPPSFLVGIK